MLETIVQAVINGLLIGGIYALVSIGVTLIFGVVKIVNFAQGEFVMIGMYISFYLATQFGMDPIVSLIVSMPVLFVIGVLIQHFLIRRVLGPNDMPQIFLTFALSLLLLNLSLMLFTRELPHGPHVLFGRGLASRRTVYSSREADRLRRRDDPQRRALDFPARDRSRQGDARGFAEPRCGDR